jgi:hypothetical protein
MIKTKKNACDLEKKLYKIVQNRYEEFKENWKRMYGRAGKMDILRKDWEDYLDRIGIEHFHCDDTEGIVECLMELINAGKDTVVCADPWINDEINYGDGDGMLAIPTKLAEKILVLGAIP